MVATDLGRTLAILHGLPTEAYGVPSIAPPGLFKGSEKSALAGLYTRFENPLPAGRQQLAEHPIGRTDPELARSLESAIHTIQTTIANRKGVLCHSDLHERQLILGEGRLAALIDFGDTTIADPGWDFASLLYFHGPAALADALVGYTEDVSRRREIGDDARLLSIGIALHHTARSRLPGKHHRLAVATTYLRNTLGMPVPPAEERNSLMK